MTDILKNLGATILLIVLLPLSGIPNLVTENNLNGKSPEDLEVVLEIQCPADITTNTNSGCYRSSLEIGVPIITNDFPLFSVTNDAPDNFFVGTTFVTWTVIDNTSESATCQQTIKIVDEIAPTFVPCIPDVTVYTQSGQCDFTTILQAPIVSDNCGIASLTADVIYPLPLGLTEITWTVFDPSGLSAFCDQNVTVVDNIPPEITCSSDIVVEISPGTCSFSGDLMPPAVNDACGIYIVSNNAPDELFVGSTDVEWDVIDNNGNESTCLQNVLVEDNVPPEIICPSNVEILVDDISGFVNVDQPTINDDCGILNFSNSQNNTEDASGNYPLGITAVLWTATDINGNTVSCVMTVTVYDFDLPSPSLYCPGDVIVNADLDNCQAYVNVDIPFYESDEDLVTLVNDYNGTDNASSIYPVGTTIVIWTGTDVNGNIHTCSMQITVEDDTIPIIECPEDVSVLVAPGQTSIFVSIDMPNAADNCGVQSLVNDYNGLVDASDNYPVGLSTVIWEAVDIHGNIATCSQNILIEDTLIPNPTCPTDFNSDNVTNGADFAYLMANFGLICSSTPCYTDFNLDGVTNGLDFTIFLGNFGLSCE